MKKHFEQTSFTLFTNFNAETPYGLLKIKKRERLVSRKHINKNEILR